MEKWLSAKAGGKHVSAIFLDFLKAFDRVWHKGLLHKLLSCGVSLDSTAWIADYLCNRSLRVRVGSSISSPQPMNAGVSQGSHLGPVLFLVFINDLPAAVNIPTELFADDALLHYQADKDNSLTSSAVIQAAVSDAEAWALSWKGKFSHSKTKLLTTDNSNTFPPPTIDGQLIEIVDTHCHLGLTVCANFQFSKHVRRILLKGSRRIGLFRCLANHLPRVILESLYVSYIRPVFEYASPVWHGSIKADEASALERLQASAARRVLRADWYTPKAVLFEELRWPCLRWRREVIGMTLFYRLLQNQQSPLTELTFPFSKDKNKHVTRKPLNLLLPLSSSAKYTKNFFFRSAIIWNSLPHTLQALDTAVKFRVALEEHWIAQKYNPCWDPCKVLSSV